MNTGKNMTIVDVRTTAEFADQHFPGAINIPLDELADKIDDLKNVSKPIVVYCRSGSRSGMAVSILKQNGIPEAVNGGGLVDMLQTKIL